MAQRYGGKYSPQPKDGEPSAPPGPGFSGKRASRMGARVNLLFVVPVLFALRAFSMDQSGLVLNFAAFAILIAAAWMTREGVAAQEAYDARRVARRPALPRKIFGSALTGVGLFTGALVNGTGFVIPAALGLIGAILHFAAFGPDPLRDKGAEGIDKFQTDRVARAVEEGEAYLKAMQDAILRAQDRGLEGRVDRFATTARQLFRTIEGDPRDLTAARREIGVFLMGARDATVKFVDLYGQTRSAQARSDYEQLLTDLESHFRKRIDMLLSNDRSDLDVEISVLRERLSLAAPNPLPDPLSDLTHSSQTLPKGD